MIENIYPLGNPHFRELPLMLGPSCARTLTVKYVSRKTIIYQYASYLFTKKEISNEITSIQKIHFRTHQISAYFKLLDGASQ